MSKEDKIYQLKVKKNQAFWNSGYNKGYEEGRLNVTKELVGFLGDIWDKLNDNSISIAEIQKLIAIKRNELLVVQEKKDCFEIEGECKDPNNVNCNCEYCQKVMELEEKELKKHD